MMLFGFLHYLHAEFGRLEKARSILHPPPPPPPHIFRGWDHPSCSFQGSASASAVSFVATTRTALSCLCIVKSLDLT